MGILHEHVRKSLIGFCKIVILKCIRDFLVRISEKQRRAVCNSAGPALIKTFLFVQCQKAAALIADDGLLDIDERICFGSIIFHGRSGLFISLWIRDDLLELVIGIHVLFPDIFHFDDVTVIFERLSCHLTVKALLGSFFPDNVILLQPDT